MIPELNRIYIGDCVQTMKTWPDNFVDAVVTDPPYEIGFMGKGWDSTGIANNVDMWREVLRVMKPGAHLVAFSATRTYHRMACAIEDAGFEIRDQIQWLYATGFPKSLDVSKAMDKMDGNESRRIRALRFTEWMRSTGITGRQINELTASCMASHYLTAKEQPEVATADMFDKLRPVLPAVPADIEELVRWRTIESENFKRRKVVGSRMAPDAKKVRLGVPDRGESGIPARASKEIDITTAHTDLAKKWAGWGTALKPANEPIVLARKPIEENTIADNVVRWGTGALNIEAARIGDDTITTVGAPKKDTRAFGNFNGMEPLDHIGRWPSNVLMDPYAAGILDGKEPDASRFFYVAKPADEERNDGLRGEPKRAAGVKNASGRGFSETDPYAEIERENFHPTVKPVDLMSYLIQLVTPRGGVVLDNFMGSGTTGKAAARLGHPFLGCEITAEYIPLAEKRIAPELAQRPLF